MTTPPGESPPSGDRDQSGDEHTAPLTGGQPDQPPGPFGAPGEWQPQWRPQYPSSDQPAPPPPPGYGQPGYGSGYGQGYGPGYGQGYAPPPPVGYAYQVPDHPKATTVMVLGIVGLVACQVVSPFAWQIGKRTLEEIDGSGGRVGGRGQAQAGYVLGIIGTVILALSVLLLVVYFIFIVAILGGSVATST